MLEAQHSKQRQINQYRMMNLAKEQQSDYRKTKAACWRVGFVAALMHHFASRTKTLSKWKRIMTTQRWISIENQDVVLWYSMGVTHLPRPED